MKPHEYRERVLAQLDAMRTHEKNRIILGLIDRLFPNGDPDHHVSGADFIAEAINLLAAFHPDNLKFTEEKSVPKDEPTESAF